MNNNASGKLLVIVAPSGAGKTTIAHRLLYDFPSIKFSTSATTRAPREGEQNGIDYFFLSDERFTQTVEQNGFIEWEYYNNHRYGTLRAEVDKLIKKGYFPLLDIEVKGATNVKRMYGSRCVSIFIEPPSLDELRQRLMKRNSETEQSLTQRMKRAEEEVAYTNMFDYSVINDDLEIAYKQVKTIVKAFTHTETS